MLAVGAGDIQVPGGIDVVASGVLGVDGNINLAAGDERGGDGDTTGRTAPRPVPVAIIDLAQVNPADIDLGPVVAGHADSRA